jgi:hypothetical protein
MRPGRSVAVPSSIVEAPAILTGVDATRSIFPFRTTTYAFRNEPPRPSSSCAAWMIDGGSLETGGS